MIKRSLLFFIIIISLSLHSVSQNFDLIITNNGDSIACFIQEISEDSVNFKMMENYEWKSKSISSNEINHYKKNAFENMSIVFKPGTSYIEKITLVKEINSVKDINRNSVYAELGGNAGEFSLNYDRLFPLGEKTGIITRGGIGAFIVLAETNFIYGGPKHFVETGIGFATNFNFTIMDFRLGYRFQAFNGFVLRLAPLLDYNVFNESDKLWSVRYGISLGYSF